jgi:spore maturation protein SpmB
MSLEGNANGSQVAPALPGGFEDGDHCPPADGADPQTVRFGLQAGLRKGWQGFLWMLKILVPVSLFTALLEWSGWIQHLRFLIEPVMNLIGLPAMAALPLAIGMLSGVYGGIGAMSVLPFSREQMTVMAIFILIAHNMVQEGVVQGQSGLHPLRATLFRIAAALVTVLAVVPFLDLANPGSGWADAGWQAAAKSLPQALQAWVLAIGQLSVKIFFIILTIMIVLEVLKAKGWITYLVWVLTPVLRLMGLNRRVGILWMTAVVFGLAYGAAVIVEEARKGYLSEQELEELHLSVGINHSMVEDPSLFLSLGLPAFWLWVPRLVTAVVAVRLLRLWRRIKSRYRRRLPQT